MNKEQIKQMLENLERDKPHFYIRDLGNYTDSFLILIAEWQNEKIKLLEELEK